MKLTDEQEKTVNKAVAESLNAITQGNVYTFMFLIEVLISLDEAFGVIYESLLYFDIKGENAYILYNDCCKRDVQSVKEVCESLKSGDITIKELRRHIANRTEII